MAPSPVHAKSHHACVSAPSALGVHRTAEIDTVGGQQFGSFGRRHSKFLKKGEVVLTFDDGPIPSQTGSILRTLRKHCAKATFFALGQLARAYPDVVARMAADGHTVANHGWNHRVMSGQSAHRIRYDIARTWHALDRASGGRAAPFFRFPYLASSPRVRRNVASLDMAIFDTDIDSKDYKTRSPSALVRRVMRHLDRRGKGILLFHDSKRVTAKALPTLLKTLARKGYKLVHVVADSSVEPPISAMRMAKLAPSRSAKRKFKAKKRRVLTKKRKRSVKKRRYAGKKRRYAAKKRRYAAKKRKYAAKKRRYAAKKRRYAAKRRRGVTRPSKRALRAQRNVRRVRTAKVKSTRKLAPARKLGRTRGFSTARR